MMAVRLEGGQQIQKALDELSTRLSNTIQREALLAGGELIRARASQLAPREPGAPDLADNIGIAPKRSKAGEVSVAIGPPSRFFFYDLFQEYGTRHNRPQPFYRPAFDSEQNRTVGVISTAFWTALIKRGFGASRGPSGTGI